MLTAKEAVRAHTTKMKELGFVQTGSHMTEDILEHITCFEYGPGYEFEVLDTQIDPASKDEYTLYLKYKGAAAPEYMELESITAQYHHLKYPVTIDKHHPLPDAALLRQQAHQQYEQLHYAATREAKLLIEKGFQTKSLDDLTKDLKGDYIYLTNRRVKPIQLESQQYDSQAQDHFYLYCNIDLQPAPDFFRLTSIDIYHRTLHQNHAIIPDMELPTATQLKQQAYTFYLNNKTQLEKKQQEWIHNIARKTVDDLIEKGYVGTLALSHQLQDWFKHQLQEDPVDWDIAHQLALEISTQQQCQEPVNHRLIFQVRKMPQSFIPLVATHTISNELSHSYRAKDGFLALSEVSNTLATSAQQLKAQQLLKKIEATSSTQHSRSFKKK